MFRAPPDRDDGDALGREVAAAPGGERLDSELIAHALDEDNGVRADRSESTEGLVATARHRPMTPHEEPPRRGTSDSALSTAGLAQLAHSGMRVTAARPTGTPRPDGEALAG